MKKEDFYRSLKSIETENLIDRIFYRPLGFRVAWSLKTTGITPNAITIISIFVGMTAGILFYFPYNISFALLGILALICANILDCVDGQLARLTGIKSEIGRVLDGLAGDIWFACVYIAFAFRLNAQFDTWIFFVIIVFSGYSHMLQAAITDYYKTLHLFFISKDKGREFESHHEVKRRYEQMKPGVSKFFSYFYIGYTKKQERMTPQLQKLLQMLRSKYGRDIPEDIRVAFREKSKRLMPIIDMLTFNGRSIVLFVSVIANVLWFYLFYEIVILNIVRYIIIRKHENICKSFYKEVSL